MFPGLAHIAKKHVYTISKIRMLTSQRQIKSIIFRKTDILYHKGHYTLRLKLRQIAKRVVVKAVACVKDGSKNCERAITLVLSLPQFWLAIITRGGLSHTVHC